MIVFFDDSCGFCHKAVLFFLKRDKQKRFQFAPLVGATAKRELAEWVKTHETVDSIVVLEKGQISYYAKAICRLLWELGGVWKVPGVLMFLPNWMLWPCNIGYRVVAKCRRGICRLPDRGALREKLGVRLLP